ncbi:MAG: hypothetical protein AAGH15_15910 [Myxococcota bacterium]
MRAPCAVFALLVACSGDGEPARTPAAPPPPETPAPATAPPAVEAPAPAPAYEEGECRLLLGPDRRFPARAGEGYGFGVGHLPAISADGARIAIDLFEPSMDEGPPPEPLPIDVDVVRVADFVFEEPRVLAPAEAWDEDDEAWARYRREANAYLREAGFQSFRRLRGPVRDVTSEGVLAKLDALEGPCRQAWGLPAGATFETRYLGGDPWEDERCRNEVHDVDLHVDLEHRVGLVVTRVGTHADLCASGVAYRAFRWVAPASG